MLGKRLFLKTLTNMKCMKHAIKVVSCVAIFMAIYFFLCYNHHKEKTHQPGTSSHEWMLKVGRQIPATLR
jgi:hypothetical protein